jgi:hypothetical protein
MESKGKYWLPIIIPIISALVAWAFNTNAEFGRRDNRLLNLERRDDRIVGAVIRLEKKIDDIKNILLERRVRRNED